MRDHVSVERLREGSSATQGKESYPIRPIPGWAIWTGAITLVAFGFAVAGAMIWLYGSGSPQDTNRLAAIRIAGTVTVSAGGLGALLLAARRLRATEVSVVQKENEQILQKIDSDERRLTDLYTSAAEQLGSDKAPVRMAGIMALERLGKAYPSHRDTVMDLLCAYLRMPYSPHTGGESGESIQQVPYSEDADNPWNNQLLLGLTPQLADALGLAIYGAEQR